MPLVSIVLDGYDPQEVALSLDAALSDPGAAQACTVPPPCTPRWEPTGLAARCDSAWARLPPTADIDRAVEAVAEMRGPSIVSLTTFISASLEFASQRISPWTKNPGSKKGFDSNARSAAIAAPARRASCGSTREEIAALADEAGMDAPEFEAKYVRKVGIRKSLIEYDNGDCVFFDGTGAQMHRLRRAARDSAAPGPSGNRTSQRKTAWKQTCEVCPGSGKGKLHSAEQVLHQISVVKL